MKKLLLPLMLATLAVGCTEEEKTEAYHGTHGEYSVVALDIGVRKLNIYDTTTNETVVAYDNDKDGSFDQVDKSYVIDNPELEKRANLDTIDAIFARLVYNDKYPAFKKRVEGFFAIAPDTVIPRMGELYGLTDVDNNGTYDIIQFMGSGPGQYEITFNIQGFQTNDLRYIIADSATFQNKVDKVLQ